MTQPIIVLPIHDPTGVLLPHLRAAAPALKALFSRALVSLSAATERHAEQAAFLHTDPFFQPSRQPEGPVGDAFLQLYAQAAALEPPDQLLHLAFPDRATYALLSEHREAFMADMRAAAETPLLYQRSAAAWRSHPRYYRELEGMITRVGELLYGRALDFAWCHLALSAGQLRRILPLVRNHDMSVLAEMVLLLRDEITTREVDWLAWEDPLILGVDARQLKRERERNTDDVRKRLSYVLPMLQVLYRDHQ